MRCQLLFILIIRTAHQGARRTRSAHDRAAVFGTAGEAGLHRTHRGMSTRPGAAHAGSSLSLCCHDKLRTSHKQSPVFVCLPRSATAETVPAISPCDLSGGCGFESLGAHKRPVLKRLQAFGRPYTSCVRLSVEGSVLGLLISTDGTLPNVGRGPAAGCRHWCGGGSLCHGLRA